MSLTLKPSSDLVLSVRPLPIMSGILPPARTSSGIVLGANSKVDTVLPEESVMMPL